MLVYDMHALKFLLLLEMGGGGGGGGGGEEGNFPFSLKFGTELLLTTTLLST